MRDRIERIVNGLEDENLLRLCVNNALGSTRPRSQCVVAGWLTFAFGQMAEVSRRSQASRYRSEYCRRHYPATHGRRDKSGI